MSETHPAQSTAGASHDGEGATVALGPGELLRLAATPTFTVLALLTGLGGTPMDGLCASGHGVPLTGMVTMYLLMSAFHLPPWLSLAGGPAGTRNPRQMRDQSSRRGRITVT
jgi:hypothetical protein